MTFLPKSWFSFLKKNKNISKSSNSNKLDWRPIASLNPDNEFELLEEWASTRSKWGFKSALEIGAYHGKSTIVLAQFFNPVYTIDLWGDRDDWLSEYESIGQTTFTPFIKNVINFKLINKIVPILGTSEVLNHLPKLNVDFIYVDGSHEYDDVRLDLLYSHKHLSDIGVIVIDDYHRRVNDMWLGLQRAVDEFVSLYNYHIVDHRLGKLLITRM